MEHKSWLWRRKPSEKTIYANEKSALNANEREKESSLERSLEELKEQLSSARLESNVKDNLLEEQIKMAEEALAGWEKAEKEAESFKQEIGHVLLQKAAAEDRIASLDAALKESMQQIRVVKEEHEHTLKDVTTKISSEQERTRSSEKRLAETNDRLAKFVNENNDLHKIIELKEKFIKDLTESKYELEESLTQIVARLDSSLKDNDSLEYELGMLQKELDIRNQDRDFHLKSADAAHKQCLESIKKISKLESECHRLRIMVRKRLPGPAAIAKMRSEVDILGNCAPDTRKKPKFATDSNISREIVSVNCYDSLNEKVSSLMERLLAIEDENKILKEALVKKNNELQSSRLMFARTASKLSHAETQLEEFSKGQSCLELPRISPLSSELPLASISEDGGTEDTLSCAESWASALISELEHFRNGKATTRSSISGGVSELSLMDDFIEMEKLAIICVDKASESPNVNPGTTSAALKGSHSEVNSSVSIGKEIVPVDSLACKSARECQLCHKSFDKHPSWLQDILRVVVQKHHITNKSLNDIVGEVSAALDVPHSSFHENHSVALCITGKTSQETMCSSLDSHAISMIQNGLSEHQFQSDLAKPLCKMIELVEGIIQRSFTDNISQQILDGKAETASVEHRSFPPTGHAARIFLWEISELTTVLQRFVVICNDLLHGKVDFRTFTSEVTSALDWVISHIYSLQDVPTMEETIWKVFAGDDCHGDNVCQGVIGNPSTETDGTMEPEEVKLRKGSSLSESTVSDGLYKSSTEEIYSKLEDENRELISEVRSIESARKDLEKKFESPSVKNQSLITQLKESDERVSSLQEELVALKYAKRLIEDQIENQKLLIEELGAQLTVANSELKIARQKFSSLEVELEYKSHSCEELEATCLELQLQLESVANKEATKYSEGQEENQLRTDWEISAASEKLAECQATILDLGKQLKALAAPRDAPLFDKVISPSSVARIKHRPQLLDQMLAEDEGRSEHLKSPKTKEIICSEVKQPSSRLSNPSDNNPNAGLLYGKKLPANMSLVVYNPEDRFDQPSPMKSSGSFLKSDGFSKKKGESDAGKLALVQKRKKSSTSFLQKLLSKRKRESSKKQALAIGS